MLSRRHLLVSSIAAVGLGLAPRLRAGEPPVSRPDLPVVDDLRRSGTAWLLSQQQADGRLVPGDRFAVGVTALGTLALCAPGGTLAKQPAITSALGFLRSFRQLDGGFYDPKEGHALYGTALMLQVFAATGSGGKAEIAAARDFLLGQPNHGDDCGFAADATGVPDLHATTAAIDGLVAAGVDPTDARLKAALRFVERCQDRSSGDGREWVTGGGGAVYSPDVRIAGGDHDTSGAAAAQVPVAYGSMTHALIADLIVLGVSPDDERIQAALRWTGQNWTVDRHPGRPAGRAQEGLFGYYAAAAKCFHLLGVSSLATADGRTIDWRNDLAQALRDRAQVQRLPDGSTGVVWRNAADRWGEALPHLTTAYALLTLAWIGET